MGGELYKYACLINPSSCPTCRKYAHLRALHRPPPPTHLRSAKATLRLSPPRTTTTTARHAPSPTPTPLTSQTRAPASHYPFAPPAKIQATMKTPTFIMPNPESMVGLPTKADENPHIQTTQDDPEPDVLPNVDLLPTPFTFGIFPRVVITQGLLLQNMAKSQADPIKANPGEYLAVVPYNAGKKFYEDNPHANRETKAFIESLATGTIDVSGIDIALPIAYHKPKRDSDGPWPMILTGAKADLARFLTWHQTFSVTRRLTFNVVPFDPDVESWVIMNISGDAVHEGDDANTFSATVPGSARQRVVYATQTFDLTFIPTQDARGVDAPIFQLTGKPITKDPALHRQWLALIRNVPGGYVVNMHALIIEKRFVECTGCKNKTHPGHSCPMPLADGWLGVVPDNAERHAERIRREQDREEGSSRRNDRNDRKGKSKANNGWTTVKHRRRGPY
ncbi:hypothetical protein MVEN_02339600 [Mycena venus]|uniref:Uncharacterized protein n=1 Tax=Mycena venus TaxID=2733690 RepID=A0A8H6X3L8_9AGAR|nr:hypothetical protein MVEN_02339600 [Mycena venus]